MAHGDSANERQFEPTPGRLARAKREGDLARSQEFPTVVAFASALFVLGAVTGPLFASGRAVLLGQIGSLRGAHVLVPHALPLAAMLVCAFAVIAAGAIGGTSAALVQTGGIRSAGLKIQMERISPVAGLRRMFSRESALAAARSLAAVACVALAAASVLRAVLAVSGPLNVESLARLTAQSSLRALWVVCAIGGVFAAFDFALVRANWRKKLRMSHEELKRDHKEHEGDPLVRTRRRSLYRKLSRGSLRALFEAAFVVTNPTHVAVALAYRPPEIAVPRVLLRAAEDMAELVRAEALRRGIPLVENVALARLLYARSKPGDDIPLETYVTVAEIVVALSHTASAR